jgi:hypothetical protein
MLKRRLLFRVQWWDPPTLVATTFVLAVSAVVPPTSPPAELRR